MRLPDFMIIGAMKCATSTLHDQLALQPGILMTTPKEPYFFSNDEVYAKGIDWYASLFDDAEPGDLCGESSTHYTKLPTYPHTVERMYKHVPDARLIYVIRHPIDRLVSHYIHDWSENKIRVSINEAIDAHRDLIDYGRYAMQLKPFIDTYGFDRILLVAFAEIKTRPQQLFERIARFIGYNGTPTWSGDSGHDNASNQRLRKSAIRDAIVWNPAVSAIRRAIVPQGFRDRIKSLWQMKNRPVLSEQSIKRLASIFDEDLAQLSEWIGREVRCENFDESLTAAPLEWRCSPSAVRAAD